MFLERLLECGHDEWCQLCRRSYRDVVDVCPVFQLGREPDLLFSHFVFEIRQRHPQGQSKGNWCLACTLQKTISHHPGCWLHLFLSFPQVGKDPSAPGTIFWLPRRRPPRLAAQNPFLMWHATKTFFGSANFLYSTFVVKSILV